METATRTALEWAKFIANTSEKFPSDLFKNMPSNCPRTEGAKAYREAADALLQYTGTEWDNYVHEIADGLVPVYYHQQWEEMNRLSLWSCNEIEAEAHELIGDASPEGNQLWQAVSAYLYAFYARAVRDVMEFIQDNAEEVDGE
jgi:hypothetical protein